jgi:peptidoglycan/xylan/chitin deacetylase (PgdA/CDA1 family)
LRRAEFTLYQPAAWHDGAMSGLQPLRRLRHRAARFVKVDPVRVAPERGILSLSFDDFPASAWTEAGPVLAQHGVKATYYVAGGLCGTTQLDRPQFEVEHLQAAHAAGHEVGCHTFEHVSVLTLSQQGLQATLDRNAAWVAERLDGHRMQTFAFPFGDWSVGAKRQMAGRFRSARGVRDGVNAGAVDRAGLSAIGLEKRRIPGYDFEALAAEAAEGRGWLVAYGHDVSDDPTDYGCTASDLERLIVTARKAGLEILPVAQALDRLGL